MVHNPHERDLFSPTGLTDPTLGSNEAPLESEEYRRAIPIYFLLSLPAVFELPQYVTAVFFLLLTLVPVLDTVFISKRFEFFDPLLLIAVMYMFMAPLPILLPSYYTDPVWNTLSSEDLDQALIWSYRGFACFICTYVTIRKYCCSYYGSVHPVPSELHENIRIAYLLGGVALFGAGTFFLRYGGAVYTFVAETTVEDSTGAQLLWHLWQMSYCYLFVYIILRLSGVRRLLLDLLLYCLLSIYALVIMGAGSKGYLFGVFVTAGMAISVSNRKFSVRTLAFGTLVLFSVYFTFRLITNYRDIVTASAVPQRGDLFENVAFQVSNFGEALAITVEEHTSGMEDSYETLKENRSAILDRFGNITSFAQLIQFSYGDPPYENAVESLLIPYYALAPRILFPEKPIFFSSGDLAELNGWSFGGVSVTLVGSLYWAWGYTGVCLGMVIVALVLAFVKTKSESWSLHGLVYKIVLLNLLLNLTNTGETFQGIMADTVRLWIGIQLLTGLAQWMNSHRSHFA